MSASTPDRSAGDSTVSSVQRDAPVFGASGGTSPVWWLLSLGSHALLLGGILFLAPTRVIDLSPSAAATHVSPARAREIIEKVRERQTESLSASLLQLRDIRKQLTNLENAKRDEFTSYARDMEKESPQLIADAQDAVAKGQAGALKFLDAAREDVARYIRNRTNVDYDSAAESLQAAKDQQAKVTQLQQRASEALSLGGDELTAARDAQAAANALQNSAAQALIESDAARSAARESRQRTPHEREIDHFTYEVRRAKTELKELPAQIEDLTKQVGAAETAVQAAQATTASTPSVATTQQPSPRLPSHATKLDANSPLGKAEKKLQTVQRKLTDARGRLESAPKRMIDDQAKADALLAEPDPTPRVATSQDERLANLQAKAIESQIQARQAQADAARIRSQAKRPEPIHDKGTLPGSIALQELDKQSPPLPVSDKPVKESDLGKIYSDAVENDGALTESYRRLRAIELAMDRRLPLDEALKLTDVAKVVRPDLKSALDASITSGQDVPVAREAIQTARAQVSAMLQLSESLLAQAEELDHTAGSSVTFEDREERYSQLQQMETMATENETGSWASDLTGLMNSGSGGPRGGGSRGGGGGGRGGGGGGGGGGGRNTAGQWPGGGGPGGDGNAGSGGPWLGAAGSGAGGGGGTAGNGGGQGGRGRGNGGQGGSGTGNDAGGLPGTTSFGSGPGATPLSDAMANHLPAWPARRVAANGPSPDWIFVDSWYILGPFDNTGRANIDTRFPPETVVDLNAVYPGKKGVPIRWEFYQSGTPNIMPPFNGYNAVEKQAGLDPKSNWFHNVQYVIYYGYTELWFEEGCDLWAAIGSDDFSKIWINEEPVWASGKRPKAWRIDEGMRKVHFNKGVNRVLFRVENANDRTEFSLVLRLR